MKQLQISDTIYEISHYHGVRRKFNITRLTKTLAISEHDGKVYKFNINYSNDGYIESYPRESGYGRSIYKIETPELKDEFLKNIEINKIQNLLQKTKWKEVDLETLKKLNSILEEINNENKRLY